jgi:hypothetical protein
MVMTLFGITIDVMDSQLSKALFPLVVTLFGRVTTHVRDSHLSKALLAMVMMLSGLTSIDGAGS